MRSQLPDYAKGGSVMGRSLKKGPFVDDHLMKKVEAADRKRKETSN